MISGPEAGCPAAYAKVSFIDESDHGGGDGEAGGGAGEVGRGSSEEVPETHAVNNSLEEAIKSNPNAITPLQGHVFVGLLLLLRRHFCTEKKHPWGSCTPPFGSDFAEKGPWQ